MPAYSPVIDSVKKLQDFIELVKRNFENEKYYKYSWETFRKRKLSQNALFQVWARKLAAHYMNKHEKLVSEPEHEDVKKTLKKNYYLQTGYEFMIRMSVDYFTNEEKPALKSTASYGASEMYEFMEWVQSIAADDGIILEAKGEYSDMKKESMK